jgi:hypothetical protein
MSEAMNLKNIRDNSNLEEKNMNAKEVKDFLAKNQVKPLNLDEWEAGQGILYVLDDSLRELHYGNFKPKPVIALLNPYKVKKTNSDRCHLYNKLGSNVYYFSINPHTKEINLERTGARAATYPTNLDDLFSADSDLFKIPDQGQN